MSKKYVLDYEDTIEHKGHTLYRIVYTGKTKLEGVSPGQKGGYVQGEHNLDQRGLSWIYDNSKVYDGAMVMHDAQVFGSSEVYDNAVIYNQTLVNGSIIKEDARVEDFAHIERDSLVCGHARINGHAVVGGSVIIKDFACIGDYARVEGSARVMDNARIIGNAQISGIARVAGGVTIGGSVYVTGNTLMSGNWSLVADVDIRKGNWEEPPIIMMGSHGPMYETKPGFIRYRHISQKITRWQAHIKNWMSSFGVSKDVVTEYKLLLNMIQKLIHRRNKRFNPSGGILKRVGNGFEYERLPKAERYFVDAVENIANDRRERSPANRRRRRLVERFDSDFIGSAPVTEELRPREIQPIDIADLSRELQQARATLDMEVANIPQSVVDWFNVDEVRSQLQRDIAEQENSQPYIRHEEEFRL